MRTWKTTALCLAATILLAACPDEAETPADLGADREAGSDATGVDAQDPLVAALYKDVHAYLTADDPGASPAVLQKLDGIYKALPLSVVEQAVRSWPGATGLPAAGIHKVSWTNPLYKGVESYQLYVPASAAKAPGRLPLIVFLHGAGGSGAGVVGNPQVLKVADGLGALLVAPTSNAKCDWNMQEDCMSQTVLLVQQLKRRYPVDDARIVLSGFSMGGRGSFSVGVAYPAAYCGVVPVAGSIGAVHNTTDLQAHKAYCKPHVENVGSLRLHYISGDQDMALMLYQNRGCELALTDLGYDYVFTELKGVGHVWPLDRWEAALTWALAKPRPPYPTRVIYNQARQASGHLPDDLTPQVKLREPQYWAVLDERTDTTKPARIEASRSGNSVTVKSTNVARLTLYFAEEAFDLDKPITISLDGAAAFSGKLTRDRRLLLTEARRRSERAATYAARKTLSAPSSP